MFCDMEGFTPLVEKLGPEEAYKVMDQIYEILIHRVHDYEGTINEMTGDGIMALFGAPIALEDAPQRAVRAAMAIHREMAKFSDRLKEEKSTAQAVKMRVGIHTGPVVVGTLGNDLRVEFKAVGETVNLASRMENLAAPGTTYVTEETFKLTEGFFRFEALGKKQVKGKKNPVKMYRVIGASTRRTRFDISAERGLTPFVGRNREFELLLDAFERTKARFGQALSIVSEAGLGKSRLLYEFRKAVTGEDVMFLEGRCLSYSRGIVYHPIIDIFKANFDIGDGDQDTEIRKKVEKGLNILGANEDRTLSSMLELLSVRETGIEKTLLSPEARKDRIMEAVKRTVINGAAIRPLILAFEDLHWVDKSSEDVLKYVLNSIPGSSVLMIFTYRPEFVHTWGAKSFHSQITLNRLSNRESLKMMSHFLGTENLDTDLEELLLEKTEGVPFFIEEFIRSLKEVNIIEKRGRSYHLAKSIQEAKIPSTIQDVIMARVDSLPENAKSVLQTGSVIEREFSFSLIKKVTHLPERELVSHLSALRDSELLYERGVFPESTYVFRHALTREVAYDSILDSRKKALHEEIANAMEELFKDAIEEYYGVLAGHFFSGGNYRKAADYSQSARKKSQKSALFNDAIEHAKMAVVCLEKLERTDGVLKEIIDARSALAGCYLNLSRNVEAKQAVEPVFDLALELDYQEGLKGIYTVLGIYNFWVEENLTRGLEYLDNVASISEETNDYFVLWYIHMYLGLSLSWNCEFKTGLEHFRKMLNLSETANNLIGIALAKANTSANNYFWRGKIDAAYREGLESLETAKESGDIFATGPAHAAYGIACFGKGFFDEAVDHLTNALLHSEKMNEVAWGTAVRLFLGDLYIVNGTYDKAQQILSESISIMEHLNILPSWQHWALLAQTLTSVLMGGSDINLNEISEHYRKNQFKIWEGWVARNIGQILMNVHDHHSHEAQRWIQEAIAADSRNDTTWLLGRDYALYAELFKRRGEREKAEENLVKAIEIFKGCGADGWVEKYEQSLESH
ncbi:MAG: ATP-binding protein [Thermodesulfobacteriota bacterium]